MLRVAQTLDVTEIADLGEMNALRSEWMALWDRCPDATPFQSPAWLVPWWRHFGRGELLVLAVRRHGRLVGLAPLFVHEDRGPRTVLPVGIGITDYLDALFDPRLRDHAATAVLRHLATQSRRWDVLELQQLPPGSPLLEAPTPAGWRDERAVQEACPVLDLPEGPEHLPQCLSRSTVRHLRANRRRAEGVGEVRIETADENSLEECLRGLFHLHGARWKALDYPGVLVDDAVQAFHRDAAAGLLAQGRLRLNVLRLEDRAAAVYYGFTAKRRAYAYLGGFDPTWARLGLGSRVIAWSIEQAVREGAEAFHFLRGAESYKYKWGARDRFTHRRGLFRTATAQAGTA